MLASPSSNQQASEVPQGLLSRLLHLAKGVVFPFDKVLCGMVAAGLCIDALCAFLGLTRALLDTHVVRLGLRTPHDAVYKERARGWSLQDTQRLIAWRAVGVHPEVIGDNLAQKRSANAVRAKCRRLGLSSPPRRELFRPDSSQLADPKLGFAYPTPSSDSVSPVDACGRPAGPIQSAFQSALVPAEIAHVEPAPSAKRVRSSRGVTRPAGQRELPFHGVVAGADFKRLKAQPSAPATPKPTIPATIADVDLSNLTWLAHVARPLSHEPSVWAIGMLMMAGLHYQAAATLTGRTAASVRTLRTRMGVPVDLDRAKQTGDFDLSVARRTHEENGYIIRRSSVEGGHRFFWIHKNDRSTRLPPTHRKRDHMIEGRWPLMTIITRKMMDERSRAPSPRSPSIRAVA